MFWDKTAGIYDLFETLYNGKVYNGTGVKVAEYVDKNDRVLECACGTGAISVFIAKKGAQLTATDFSEGMLRQAKKKLRAFSNVSFEKADITALKYDDNSFDVVVAGNVIHLLADPAAALAELKRVCKPGGKLIIPTYINGSKGTNKAAVKLLEKLGANFKRQFDSDSYHAFFEKLGYENAEYYVVEGRMSCDIAVIKVTK